MYGQLGLGKTSSVLVALHGSSFIHHVCSNAESFQSVFLDILQKLNAQFLVVERTSKQSDVVDIGYDKVIKLSTGNEASAKESAIALQTLDPNFVVEKLRGLEGSLKAIVIDEFQNITDPKEQRSVLEIAKILSDHSIHIPLMLIGHGPSDTSLFQTSAYQEYKGRYFTAFEVQEMLDAELESIITIRQANYTPQAVRAIVNIAAGYPAHVHRLALKSSLTWTRQNKYTNVKPDWRAAVTSFWGFDLSTEFSEHIEPVVSLRHVAKAACEVVQEDKAKHPNMFASIVRRLSDLGANLPESEKAIVLPVQLSRGAGYIAKVHLEIGSEPAPDFLFPEGKVDNQKEVLQRWANFFFPFDLSSADETLYIRKVCQPFRSARSSALWLR